MTMIYYKTSEPSDWSYIRSIQRVYILNDVYGMKMYYYVDDGFGTLIPAPHTEIADWCYRYSRENI